MPHVPADPSVRALAVSRDGDRFVLDGALDSQTLCVARSALQQQVKRRKPRALDLDKLTNLDAPGPLFL